MALAKGHRPDICFPAAGWNLAQDFGRTNILADGVVLPFLHQSFENGDTLRHVFYCLWSDYRAPETTAVSGYGPWNGRLQAVMAGERNLGQQVVEVVIQGPDSSDEAVSTLKEELPHLIRRE